jgi:UDP-N-acetylmuramoylalanine--D-glutamate ligase
VDLQNKIIAVIGLGASGRAACELLVRVGAGKIIGLDNGSAAALAETVKQLKSLGIETLLGAAAETFDDYCDLAILSPGVPPSSKLVRGFTARGTPVLGELELAYCVCGRPVVGITGTNGKTTTTELVAAMLPACGISTVACGNIGPAFSAQALAGRSLDVITVEVSSFQLETIRTFRPSVAVWLGFAADHLDRYASLQEYRAAKMRIFENQTESDWAVVNANLETTGLRGRIIRFSATNPDAELTLNRGTIYFRGNELLPMEETRLRGAHNAENLMAAIGVGIALGLEPSRLLAPLKAYQPLPHRCEHVLTHEGVEYVNDSKSTNIDSLEKALAGETRPVVLIAGGKDKGFDFNGITDLVGKKVRHAVLIGEMKERIAAAWKERVSCELSNSLTEAVQAAHSAAQPGDIVLFSPGTSSFDMFKHYADRGEQFRAIVKALSNNQP